MLFLLPLGFDVVSPTHWNKIIYSYTHKVSKVSFSLSHIYLYSSKHTHSHTRSSRRYQRGRCCSWVFDPPAATTAGWLTFCLIMYKWSISRCVPAAARGLLFGLLHLDIVIFTPQKFDWCSESEKHTRNECMSVHFRVTQAVHDRRTGLSRRQTCDV